MRNEAVFLGATNVQVLDRGLDLIELLATAEHGMTISELVAATGLPKSTVHRILATFTNRHYVEKNEETSVYSLGYKFVELASLYLNKIVLKTEAEPIMHTLAQILHATTYLGVLENNEVMYLQKTEQRNSLRLYTSIGKREPLYCTALGKVLLASLPLTWPGSFPTSLTRRTRSPTMKISHVRSHWCANAATRLTAVSTPSTAAVWPFRSTTIRAK